MISLNDSFSSLIVQRLVIGVVVVLVAPISELEEIYDSSWEESCQCN